MIRCRFIHGQVFENLDDLVLIPNDKIESGGRIECAVFNLNAETISPRTFVGGENTEGVLGILPACKVRGRCRLHDAGILGAYYLNQGVRL